MRRGPSGWKIPAVSRHRPCHGRAALASRGEPAHVESTGKPGAMRNELGEEKMSTRTWYWIAAIVVIILAIYFFTGSSGTAPEATPTPPAATEPAAPSN